MHWSVFYISDLRNVIDRNIVDLSGGELQRFACAIVCIQEADVIMFDEPSSYLDVKQRINAAQTIRSLLAPDKWASVAVNDLVLHLRPPCWALTFSFL